VPDSCFTLSFHELASQLGVTYGRVYRLYSKYGRHILAERRAQRLYFRPEALEAFRKLIECSRERSELRVRYQRPPLAAGRISLRQATEHLGITYKTLHKRLSELGIRPIPGEWCFELPEDALPRIRELQRRKSRERIVRRSRPG
jgi:transposase